MSRRRKKPRYTDINASIGSNDYFGTVFDGMFQHPQFQKLTCGARLFYCYCRVQAKSEHGRSCLYQHGKEFGITYTDADFVFPAKHLEMYGYDRSNATRYFKELENAGFLTKKEKNKHMKKVNVYSFSDRWKNSS